MTPKHIIALTVCALALAACNRESTDQGGTSQEPATGTRRDRATPPAPTAPAENTPSASATAPADQTDAAAKPADNTGRNVRDRSDAAVTPGDQSESKADLELTRQIRSA